MADNKGSLGLLDAQWPLEVQDRQVAGSAITPEGHFVYVPNDTYRGDGFYVSFNSVDHRIYGDVTTALVKGQMESFYILNGDHRPAYFELIPQGFEACIGYFEANVDQVNKRSDRIERMRQRTQMP